MISRNSQRFSILITFLILSLLTHFGLYYGLVLFPRNNLDAVSNQIPIEVTFNSSSEKKAQQFVTDPDLGELADKLKEQSRLLSRFNRRVKQETVASMTGATKNRVPKQPSPSQAAEKKQASSKEKFKNTAPEGFSFRPEKSPSLEQYTGQSAITPSTIAEHIPNVKRGGFTVLNTDQFSFYSFFNRINEQIRLRWVSKIRNFSYTLPAKTINQLALFGRETKVELVLNSKGEYVSSFVDQTSGAEFLDRATIDSFIEASPFINPPQDLVDADGFIRLNYSFYVEWQSRHLAKD